MRQTFIATAALGVLAFSGTVMAQGGSDNYIHAGAVGVSPGDACEKAKDNARKRLLDTELRGFSSCDCGPSGWSKNSKYQHRCKVTAYYRPIDQGGVQR
ncbi:hypothetical protein [Sphingopyxis sp. 113P3]|uniref:hypothetical protein n=1 Tax=Sphingopyxis sp. (strain 113P3) TaxID=292913 RepID=UPI0006AD104F|nr:hypothetical protein [Sphingopyxis sp. 113P3]ALC11488.1 Major facilitator superfamily protein [Sphingopyxis sp. 113P3]